jgi:predicted metal-dependent phosphoesterase TrpH
MIGQLGRAAKIVRGRSGKSSARAWPAMVKVDLHIHTADDPVDKIPYSGRQLVDRAAALGFGALAITLHDRQFDRRRLSSYAADRGIALIPGIERTIEGRHVLLLNFSPRTENVRSFDDLARLRQAEPGLVIAPHPFFPAPSCLRGLLDRHADLFDAVEWNAMFTRQVNFNRRAARWAAARGKPVVGNGDVHRLYQLGTCCSYVDAPADADAVCDAIRAGRVTVEARPLSPLTAGLTLADVLIGQHVPFVTESSAPAPARS